jgi:hypothetical protein
MFTVMVDFDGSGNTNSLRPFSSWYWVIPSTDVTFVTPAGNAAFWAPLFGARPTKRRKANRARTEFFNGLISWQKRNL